MKITNVKRKWMRGMKRVRMACGVYLKKTTEWLIGVSRHEGTEVSIDFQNKDGDYGLTNKALDALHLYFILQQ